MLGGGKCVQINLIHKSDVYFNLLKSLDKRGISFPAVIDDMHQGEVYFFLNQILFHDSNCWYKANIQEL